MQQYANIIKKKIKYLVILSQILKTCHVSVVLVFNILFSI